MKNELKPKEYKRFTPKPIEADSTLEAVLNMTIESLKQGRPPAYSDTEQGLEEFKQTTIDYFQYVKDTNANPDIEKMLVPDIEALCTFLGITRATLLTYEKQRGSSWQDFIKQTKNAIAACKKELAFHQQIPPVIAMFDLTNNHSYVNSSEFRIEPISDKVPERHLSLEEQIQQAGLVWNDEKGEYIPAIEAKGVLSE
ncbi:MAG: DNA-packaging protein [Lachnospiraceae bacterium]|nr:DNA-packaging protein [Lachnospiraceae bacterium]